MIIDALVSAGPTFQWFRDFIFWGLITILSTFQNNHSLMGWSDVVHYVGVPLIGTTMATFGVYLSSVGIGLCTIYLLYTILWTLGAPLSLLFNGPTFWHCSQVFESTCGDDVIFPFVGLFVAVPLLCPNYWGRRTARRGPNNANRNPQR